MLNLFLIKEINQLNKYSEFNTMMVQRTESNDTLKAIKIHIIRPVRKGKKT